MTDDGPYFGYTTGGNAALMRERWMARHTGDDILHYQPPEETVPYMGRTSQAVSEDDRFYDDNLRDVSKHSTVEQVYHRIMGQNPDAVETIGDQWAVVRYVIDDLTTRVLGIADALKYGGSGTDTSGVGWTGAGADEFLKRGPGATLKSLDDWRQFAIDTEAAAYMIAATIRRYQSKIYDYYWNTYVPVMSNAANHWWGWSQVVPPTLEGLANAGPDYWAMREDYINNLREAEMPLRPAAQKIQWDMAQEYWSTLTQELAGRPTVYEGPTNAVQEDPNAIAAILAPKIPNLPPMPNPPTIPAPPTPPTVPGPPVPPGVPNPPGGTGGTGAGGGVGDPGVPGIGDIPVMPPLPGLGGGAGGRLPGVLRGGLGAADAAGTPAGQGLGSRPPGMPPGRPGGRPDKDPSRTGRPVGPEPEEFPGGARVTPPPVLRRPEAGGTPPPRRERPGGGRSGADALAPPEGVAPPVVGRPIPAKPEPPPRRPARAGTGTENEFAPPLPPVPSVVARTQAPDEPMVTEQASAGVLSGPRPSRAVDAVGRRDAAEPPVRTAATEEFDKIRALLLDGESAWSVVTPGGGVVASGQRPAEPTAEPPPQLRAGAL
jgi:hypothetical protein